MAVDVSVVVPIFNAGPNLQDCIASLRAQSLPRDRFELVAVDDGSTDGTAERLDRLAASEPDWVRVHHIPASGWPGRPRNIGIREARGRFVQLLDADDTLGERALQRQLEVAEDSDADLVLGKLVTDFRALDHPIFRRTLTRRTFRDFPMVESLTPHKLFRREFLLEHDIRFPEGPRYIEDASFCVHAYVHARSVAVVGDTPCYFYRRRRDAGQHLSATRFDPDVYYACVDDVLDLIDTHVHDPEDRSALAGRFLRKELLSRTRGVGMLRYDDAYRSATVAAARRTAQRFPAGAVESVGGFLRPQARLLRAGDDPGMLRFAQRLDQVRLTATADHPDFADGRLRLTIHGQLLDGEEPLRLSAAEDGWMVPDHLSMGGDDRERTVSEADVRTADVDCAVVSRQDGMLWSTTEGLTLTITTDGIPEVRADLVLDLPRVAGGSWPADGLWDVRLRVTFAGLARSSPLRPASEPAPSCTWLSRDAAVTAYWTSAEHPTLALDVGQWLHPVQALLAADTAPEPQLAGRRLRLRLPTVKAAPDLSRPARVLLEPSAETPVVECPATVVADGTGAALEATLPRLDGDTDPWQLWVRVGEPGGAEPIRLPHRLGPGRRSRHILLHRD